MSFLLELISKIKSKDSFGGLEAPDNSLCRRDGSVPWKQLRSQKGLDLIASMLRESEEQQAAIAPVSVKETGCNPLFSLGE